jgi:hypothetical protein
MTNLDINKLMDVRITRADIHRWMGWSHNAIYAGEKKGIFGAFHPPFSALTVLNYALSSTQPGSDEHNRALSWMKFLTSGERDGFYVPTEEERLQVEIEAKERNKTPQDRYREASYQADQASQRLNSCYAQIAGFKRQIAVAEESLKQYEDQLERLQQTEAEALARKEESGRTYDAWTKAQAEPVEPQPEPQPVVVESVKPKLPSPQVERRKR